MVIVCSHILAITLTSLHLASICKFLAYVLYTSTVSIYTAYTKVKTAGSMYGGGIYVCMSICMYVFMYVVYLYVCMHVCTNK